MIMKAAQAMMPCVKPKRYVLILSSLICLAVVFVATDVSLDDFSDQLPYSGVGNLMAGMKGAYCVPPCFEPAVQFRGGQVLRIVRMIGH